MKRLTRYISNAVGTLDHESYIFDMVISETGNSLEYINICHSYMNRLVVDTYLARFEQEKISWQEMLMASLAGDFYAGGADSSGGDHLHPLNLLQLLSSALPD